MSFSTDIKEELCELQTASACCKKAEALGMLIFSRSFSLSEMTFMTELNCVAFHYCNLIEELTGVKPVISYSKAGNHKVRIDTKEDRQKILDFVLMIDQNTAVQRIYQHLSTPNKLFGDSLIIADANKDGTVTFADIQRVYQHISTPNKLF